MRQSIAILVAVSLCGSAPAANAARVPFWYWTAKQANTAVVRQNLQVGIMPHHTTTLAAVCRGVGASKRVTGGRGYAEFSCLVRFRDDVTSVDGNRFVISIRTSHAKRGLIACWSRSHAGLSKDCA